MLYGVLWKLHDTVETMRLSASVPATSNTWIVRVNTVDGNIVPSDEFVV